MSTKLIKVKQQMYEIFEHLNKTIEEDISSLDPKERVKLVLEYGKILMPKSDIEASEEKANKAANTAQMADLFNQKLKIG